MVVKPISGQMICSQFFTTSCMNMPCLNCVCVSDFTRIYWSVKLKRHAEASYHGGSKGNVVNERGGQS